jgi:hypothetical protein
LKALTLLYLVLGQNVMTKPWSQARQRKPACSDIVDSYFGDEVIPEQLGGLFGRERSLPPLRWLSSVAVKES